MKKTMLVVGSVFALTGCIVDPQPQYAPQPQPQYQAQAQPQAYQAQAQPQAYQAQAQPQAYQPQPQPQAYQAQPQQQPMYVQQQGGDYVATHMQQRAGQFASGMVSASPLHRGFLNHGQEADFQTQLQAGYCYRVIGVGDQTMSDLDLFIFDENGNQIAQDVATDNFPVLGLQDNGVCPRWTGPFVIRARAYSGTGQFGLQLYRTP